jgi:3-oxoacyl-[acyl-carrier protein] reductase
LKNKEMNSTGILSDKVCLVTGAAKGIGKAIATKFAEEKAVIYVNAREPDSINEWAAQCSAANKTKVVPVYFDITDHQAAKEAVLMIRKEHQRLDVLVNNAAVITYELLGMIDFMRLREMFEVNVISLIHLIQLSSRLMIRQRSGSIINISSIVGVQGASGQLGYSATKGAVISVTRSAAKELAPHNIRVNALAPGMIDTERFREVFERQFKDRLANVGMGRLGKPEEIANTCAFLASDLAEYISGQIIGVDGCTRL